MKCLILCADHNDDATIEPYALMEIDEGITALDVLIDQVHQIAEIDQIYVVTNGKSYDAFLNWYDNRYSDVKIINDNTTSPDAKLGAIGDIKFTLNCENINDDLLIIAGDAVYDFDLLDIYNYYKLKEAPVVAVKKALNLLDLKRYGVVRFDDDNKIIEMHEKVTDPIGSHIALALYFYPKEVIRTFDYYLSEGNKTTSPGYFLEYLYPNIDTYAYVIDGEYYTLK